MTVYTQIFGGATIYPSEVDYSAITLSTDVVLEWPLETALGEHLATKIIDVTPVGAGLSIFMPAASSSGTGQTVLFNNLGAVDYSVRDSAGTLLMVISAGTLWQTYLTDNSTEEGVWVTLQYGVGVSQAQAASLAGPGLKALGTLLGTATPTQTINSDYAASSPDRAKAFIWTGASGTLALDAPATVGNDWFIHLRNSGSGGIVVNPAGAATINGASLMSFQPGESATIITDGIAYYTIGFGQSAAFAFDYTVIDVSGSGVYTLTGSELNRIAYNFGGVLTGNRIVVVPNTIQQYWVSNTTTGAFDLTIKTAAGTGITIAQSARAILYCDGINVVDADTSTVSLPVQISQGGTSATTASNARTNLGATGLGDTIFTAVNAAAVWSALGAVPASSLNVNGGTF